MPIMTHLIATPTTGHSCAGCTTCGGGGTVPGGGTCPACNGTGKCSHGGGRR